ncbi:MAG: CBS domain-containing protein, partial [Moorea sp. SIO2B7]|nr:CBS domain-containing protein [Moorena sp. SIO2B7]
SDTPIIEVMTKMNQLRGSHCVLPETASWDQSNLSTINRFSCVLVTEKGKLVGVFTERDIVQFQLLELELTHLEAAEVMSAPLFSLNPTDSLWSVDHNYPSSVTLRKLKYSKKSYPSLKSREDHGCRITNPETFG